MISLYYSTKTLFVEGAVEGDVGQDNAKLGWVVKSSSLVVGLGPSNSNAASSSKSSGIGIDGLGRDSS